ncbi:MAG: hypothetical protein M1127_00585 [Patescibacteria group bacterium]|nr:hypothetical protein [Patescibacteria group bacterium]
MIEKTFNDKKYYGLTEEECRKLLKLGGEAIKNTYPESKQGFSVALPIKLKLQKTTRVKPAKPFAFDPTFHKPDHFTSGDNYWEPGVRWQAWNWQGKCLGIKFSNKGTALPVRLLK